MRISLLNHILLFPSQRHSSAVALPSTCTLLLQAQRPQRFCLMSSTADNSNTATDSGAAAPKKKCIPCSTMDPSFLLDAAQVQERLDESFPLWTLDTTSESTKPCIRRKFVTKNFKAALECVNAMGAIAERENHHPDFHMTNYRYVEVVLWTHKVSGITESDLTVASMLDNEVKVAYSPKWLEEHPEAKQ